MRGIATIERHTEGGTFAIWVTSRSTSLGAASSNAVVIQREDPSGVEKARSLTRCCAVLITEGSTIAGLPIEGSPLVLEDWDGLLREVKHHQRRICEAVEDYRRRTRSSLVRPDFPAIPRYVNFLPANDRPGSAACSLARFVGRAWTTWLKTDEERRRRTVQPKTGKTPWIMPEDMNGFTVPDFPPGFASRLTEQPLV